MTWLDWLKILAFMLAISVIVMAILVGLFWLSSKPVRRGPERIVDVKNRGMTRIRMPDGTIR